MGQRVQFHEALNMSDMINLFSCYRRSIIFTPLLFVVFALILRWIFIPPLYEAEAVLQVGQVNGDLIETSAVVLDRVKNKSFISEIIASNPNAFPHNKSFITDEELLAKYLNVDRHKETELVFVSLRARSSTLAIMQIKAIFSKIKSAHDDIFDLKVNGIRRSIELTDALQANELKSIQPTRDPQTKNTFLDALVSYNKLNQLQAIGIHKLELEEALSNGKTFKTNLLGKIYISRGVVSASSLLIGLIAFFIGLFGALAYALIRDSLNRSAT